jgi:hypothetical protein
VPACGEFAVRGESADLELDWALMEGPRGL